MAVTVCSVNIVEDFSFHLHYRTTQNRDLDLTTKIHNASVYTKSLCHVTDIMSGPVLQSLESRLERNKNRIESLKKEKEELLMQLEKT